MSPDVAGGWWAIGGVLAFGVIGAYLWLRFGKW